MQKLNPIANLSISVILKSMNWKPESFNWNQAKSFLVAVEKGSLSAAARDLGLTQPTLSRQISNLEESLGVVLLERGHRSLSLTQPGLDLLEHVRTMQEAANRVSLSASGQSQAVEGQVCITASDSMSCYHLPPLLKKLRAIEPGIQVEVHSSNEVKNLLRREADIAIRHVRPKQLDLITKLVSEPLANLYASTSYLDELGRVETNADLSNAAFIGFESAERALSVYTAFGLSLTASNIRYIINSGTVLREMIKQGLGIGILDENTAAITDGIESVLPSLEPIAFPIWLTTHRELHTSRRIRIVYDFLASELKKAEITTP